MLSLLQELNTGADFKDIAEVEHLGRLGFGGEESLAARFDEGEVVEFGPEEGVGGAEVEVVEGAEDLSEDELVFEGVEEGEGGEEGWGFEEVLFEGVGGEGVVGNELGDNKEGFVCGGGVGGGDAVGEEIEDLGVFLDVGVGLVGEEEAEGAFLVDEEVDVVDVRVVLEVGDAV